MTTTFCVASYLAYNNYDTCVTYGVENEKAGHPMMAVMMGLQYWVPDSQDFLLFCESPMLWLGKQDLARFGLLNRKQHPSPTFAGKRRNRRE